MLTLGIFCLALIVANLLGCMHGIVLIEVRNNKITDCFFLLSDMPKLQQMAAHTYPSFSHSHQFEWHRAKLRQLETQGHVVVNTFDGKLRPCKYCSDRKIKTRLGHMARTRNKCHLCDVPLCTKNRDCFNLYHEWLLK